MDEIWNWDAVAIARGVRTRRISSREAVLACLKRIDEVNPRVNAVVETRPEEALEAADAADAAVARGDELGPLHGVPVTTKVNVDQAGYATTNGVVAFRDTIADQDSPPVANWRRAGAVFVGRTNTPAFSHRWFTGNDLHGETLNPHNRNLTPGGSSGGAAAALASGMAPLAHGNDYGGSIRYPAYACGVVGLRPSLGRVPAFNGTVRQERPITGRSYRSRVRLRAACETCASAWPPCADPMHAIPGGLRRPSSDLRRLGRSGWPFRPIRSDAASSRALRARLWPLPSGSPPPDMPSRRSRCRA
jgi:amidase